MLTALSLESTRQPTHLCKFPGRFAQSTYYIPVLTALSLESTRQPTHLCKFPGRFAQSTSIPIKQRRMESKLRCLSLQTFLPGHEIKTELSLSLIVISRERRNLRSVVDARARLAKQRDQVGPEQNRQLGQTLEYVVVLPKGKAGNSLSLFVRPCVLCLWLHARPRQGEHG